MISGIRDLWWLTRSCRKIVVILLIAALFQQALHLAVPLAIGKFVDILSTNDPAHISAHKFAVVCLIIGALCGGYFLQFFIRHGQIRMIHLARGYLVCDAFDHILRLPVGFHESRDTGNKTKTIQNGTDKAIGLADSWAMQGIPTTIYYLFSSGILFYIWWPAGVILGAGVPIVVGLSVLFYRFGKEPREERHDCYNEAESLLVEGIQNIATIQSFRMEESQSQRMRSIWKRVYQKGFQELKFADIGYVIRNITILISLAAVLWFGIGQVVTGAITGGTLIIVFFLTMRMTNDLWFLGQLIDRSIQDAPALRRLRELFSIESEIQESPIAVHLPECRGELVFDSVNFRYPGTDIDAVKGFSLLVEAGTTVALVGPSGAGKSTVFKLARRFIDPAEGSVYLDGHDLRNLKLDFRQRIAVVSQEIEIFSDTIANNIRAGNMDLSETDVRRVAAMAYMDSFVQLLPAGYNTQVGERGLKLSGGERQRLAIARALAADCSIFLFDEATSGLDVESEMYIQMAMKTLMGNRTLLVIAHRLSTIHHADRIVVMEHGGILEEGTHQSLKSLDDGLYRKYLDIQSS